MKIIDETDTDTYYESKGSSPITKIDNDCTPELFKEIEFIRKQNTIPKSYFAYILNILTLGAYINKFKFKPKVRVLTTNENNDICASAEYAVHKSPHFLIIKYLYSSMQTRTYVFTDDFAEFKKSIDLQKKIPNGFTPGLYKLIRDELGELIPKLCPLKNQIKPVFNKDIFSELKNDIDIFKSSQKIYTLNNLDYKRGILLYGPPGCGKTAFLKYILAKEHNTISIIVNSKDWHEINFICEKLLQDHRLDSSLKIIVFEDIDGVPDELRSKILNIIDGIIPINNIIFIATTNFPDRLDTAFVDRPSRFDRFYEITFPDLPTREKLLRLYFPKLPAKTVKEIAKTTDKFTGAYFKELFILTTTCNKSVTECVEIMKKRFDTLKNFNKTNYMG